MDIIRVADTETTGQPPECDIIEIGWTDVSTDGEILGPPSSMIVRPSRKIEIGAMAVHHISQLQADEGCDEATWKTAFETPPAGCRIIAYAAHNADFEKSVLGHVSPWLCTYRSALSIWEEPEKHSNQYLRYWLALDLDPNLAQPVHRAGPDSYVTAGIITRLLREITLEQMLHATERPILLKKIGFGKHFGTRFDEIDHGYLTWLLKNVTDNPDLTFTVQHELERRAEDARQARTEAAAQTSNQPGSPRPNAATGAPTDSGDPAAPGRSRALPDRQHAGQAHTSHDLPATTAEPPAAAPVAPDAPSPSGGPYESGFDFGSLFSVDTGTPSP